MSYEGYERFLCANGHLDEDDCYSAPDRKAWRCGDCGAGCVWWEPVDQTNGEGKETELKLVTPPVMPYSCECCGHKVAFAPAVYEIPLDGRVE